MDCEPTNSAPSKGGRLRKIKSQKIGNGIITESDGEAAASVVKNMDKDTVPLIGEEEDVKNRRNGKFSKPKSTYTRASPLKSVATPPQDNEAEDGKDELRGDMNNTLEYLRKWTVSQDHLSRQLVEHQKRLENLMQSLLQNDVSRKQAFPQFDVSERWKEKLADATNVSSIKELTEDGTGSQDTRNGPLLHQDTKTALPDFATSLRSSKHSLGRLHSVFVQAIWNLPTHDHGDHRTWHLKMLEDIVEHPYFEYFAACVIFLHSVFIGAYVEYLASESSEKHPVFIAGNIIFVIVFCLEVGVKLAAERQEFFLGDEWRWNVFDICLIATVFIEIIISIASSGKDDKKRMKTVLKIAEMVRTLRILRIFRMLKFSTTLRVIVSKILTSAKSLLWILILVALMLYVVAVCLTQCYNDFLDGEQHDIGTENLTGNKKQMNRHFGSIPRSAYTLFASTTGGIIWGEVLELLGEVSFFYAGMFILFTAINVIAVMNLITGVFVDDAIRADADIVMEAEAKAKKEQADHLRKMFDHMDRNESGAISLEEFLKFAHNPSLEVYLKALGINADEAETLFQLLDEDGSGYIQTEEFLTGCMHLRGDATSLDMKTLLYENRRMRHKVFKYIHTAHQFMMWQKEKLDAITPVAEKESSTK